MTRVGRLFGAAFTWLVVGAACLVVLGVCLPLLAVAALLRGLYELGRVLIRHGEMSGADDLDDVLRAQIDGDDEAYSVDVMACGCTYAGVSVTCDACGWRTCMDHAAATHLCERDPIRSWQDASLTPAVEAGVNEAFARIAARLSDLNRVDKQLSRYYLIGDEK